MGRFSIERSAREGKVWLGVSEDSSILIDRADADEIRRLLDEAFPVEPMDDEDRCVEVSRHGQRCTLPLGHSVHHNGNYAWHGKSAAEPAVQQPATDDPDPDEVRRALGGYPGVHAPDCLFAAAESWLRMREQQPEPGPTIAQVIEACDREPDTVHLLLRRHSGDRWTAHPCRYYADSLYQIIASPLDVQETTPEAAIRALYDDAVSRLRQQRDEAEQKLAKLGVG